MRTLLKRTAARLPNTWQQELKRRYFSHQIKRQRFVTDEKEYGLLDDLLQPGDWVLDIGANIGHYSAKFSTLVGAEGRVIAFEPVAETFELLAANMARQRYRNITLINAAASEETAVLGMSIPKFDSGLDNYYMAHLAADSDGFQVMCLSIDSLQLPQPVKLAKIDAEGHEMSVLQGMEALLRRDHPLLIVEDNSPEISDYLQQFGYEYEHLSGSSNRIFR